MTRQSSHPATRGRPGPGLASGTACVRLVAPRPNRKKIMHYKNGRIAKNGDKVVLVSKYGAGTMRVGILYDAVAGNDHCNGKLATMSPGDPMPDLKECLHLDDVMAAFPAEVPNSSVPE